MSQKSPQSLRQTVSPASGQAPRIVEVVILAGEMKVRGERLKVERASLRIAEGASRELLVRAGEEKETVTIRYHNGELIFAENFKGGRDTMRLPFEREWGKGKVYRFALKGRIALEKIEVRVSWIEARWNCIRSAGNCQHALVGLSLI